MKEKFSKIILASVLSLGLLGVTYTASAGPSEEFAGCYGSYMDHGVGDVVPCE